MNEWKLSLLKLANSRSWSRTLGEAENWILKSFLNWVKIVESAAEIRCCGIDRLVALSTCGDCGVTSSTCQVRWSNDSDGLINLEKQEPSLMGKQGAPMSH